jgi:four helix bundle protein
MRYRDLIVWQKAMDLVVEVYRLSQTFPATEKFGLASQIQRAAVSPSNIAEGHARKSSGAFVNHLSIAAGSLAELETQIMLAERLKLCPKELSQPLLSCADEIGCMLTGLKASLTNS